VKQVSTLLGPMWVHDAEHLGQVLSTGVFWDGQLQQYLDQAPPGTLVVDVGANVGFISRYMAQKGHPVIAVEAWPDTVILLRMNTEGLPVSIIEGVAYDRYLIFTLAPAALLGWEPSPCSPNVSSYAFLPDWWHGTIPGVVLDNYIQCDTKVGLIKVDAQGCDLRALRGLRSTILRDRPLILFEFEAAASSWQGDVWEDYLLFFKHLNYEVERVREDIWDYVATPR